MLTAWARRTFRVILEPIARFLHRLGLTPNALTLIGLILQGIVAVVIAMGNLLLGGVLLIVFSAFDSLDGTLARMTGQVSKFGAFLDATVDRYAELFRILLKHDDAVTRVTFWGVHDGYSWKNGWPIPGRTNYPLLFDRSYKPKPAYHAVISEAENLK